MKEKLVGKITHYFGNIDVAIIKLQDTLKVGDMIHIVGNKVDFTQLVSSMQIDHENVTIAQKGSSVGLKVDGKTKEGDEVFLV
jgi:putative protease